MNKKENTDTVHYILTFISFILLVGCFATSFFTGKPALVQFDSLAGSLVLGSIFLYYSFWFVYEDLVTKQISFTQSFVMNLKTNPTFIFVFLFWLVLIIIPFLCNLLLR